MTSSSNVATKADDIFTPCSGNPYPEGFDATSKRSGSKPFVARSVQKRGRKRGARSMGRYPFMNAAHQYLEAMKGLLAETTWIEYERRLRRMDKDFKTLLDAKVIDNYNPWKMTDKDVMAYLKLLKARGMKPSGICHNVDMLNSVLHFVGNSSMDKARLRFAQSFPKRNFLRYDPIHDDDRINIIQSANNVSDKDWQLMLGYGITIVGICTGLRPKEIRLAKIGDLNLEGGVLHTDHVKGENSYGEARNTGIHPDGIPFLRRYVKVRAMMTAKAAPTCEALFPAIQDMRRSGDGYYSANGLTILRQKVIAQTGVKYDCRACRRTFGQTSVDANIPIESISRMMGHSNTNTTEKYYCRKTSESAISDAQKMWGNAPRPCEIARSENVKNPLIEKKTEITGYA
jgi:integrase/recombinase XerD